MPTIQSLLQQVKASIQETTPAELNAQPAQVVIDVRESDEYNDGYIPGAQWIPRGKLELRIEDAVPDRGSDIVLYCAGGNRSALAASEAAAQSREEQNALYVAMTRARQRLVLSGVTPHGQAPHSWWLQLQPQAQELPVPEPAPASAHPGQAQAEFIMLDLPPAPVLPAQEAIKSEAFEGKSEAASDDASRIGEAMHRLLEWWRPGGAGWSAAQRLSVQRATLTMRTFGHQDDRGRRTGIPP